MHLLRTAKTHHPSKPSPEWEDDPVVPGVLVGSLPEDVPLRTGSIISPAPRFLSRRTAETTTIALNPLLSPGRRSAIGRRSTVIPARSRGRWSRPIQSPAAAFAVSQLSSHRSCAPSPSKQHARPRSVAQSRLGSSYRLSGEGQLNVRRCVTTTGFLKLAA